MAGTGIVFFLTGAMLLGQVTRLPSFLPGYTEELRYAGDGNPTAREKLVKKVSEVRRADYEGDRASLRQLFVEMENFDADKELAPYAHYWRGFAMWRRAINGFNAPAEVSRGELEGDVLLGALEFREAQQLEPEFVDATIGEAGCEMILIYLTSGNPEEQKKHIQASIELVKKIQTEEPDNPRFLWIWGSSLWARPAAAGGSQVKAFEAYRRGLETPKKTSDGLAPDWGKPELLMSLAWSNLNATEPDLVAARKYGQEALEIVPRWHYVKDILLPQIEQAANAENDKKLLNASKEKKAMGNPVLQFQILSKDPEATGEFFAELFGWNIGASDRTGYRRIDTGSTEGIQGGIWPTPPGAASFAQLFVGVRDIRASIDQATKLGAKLLVPPTALPDGGQVAILHDPLGLPFALWQRK